MLVRVPLQSMYQASGSMLVHVPAQSMYQAICFMLAHVSVQSACVSAVNASGHFFHAGVCAMAVLRYVAQHFLLRDVWLHVVTCGAGMCLLHEVVQHCLRDVAQHYMWCMCHCSQCISHWRCSRVLHYLVLPSSSHAGHCAPHPPRGAWGAARGGRA